MPTHPDAQLRSSERRFRDVIERNADAIVIVDHEGIVRFANSAASELFGRPRSELIGTSFGFPLVAGETTELDLLSKGEPRVAEMRVVDSEWEEAPAFIASLRDITERHHAEQNARRLFREQADRAAAESALRRFRFLAESSAVLSSSLDSAATLSSLARLCASEIADWVIVYSVDGMGVLQHGQLVNRDGSADEFVRAPGHSTGWSRRVHPVVELLREKGPLIMRELEPGVLDCLLDSGPRQRFPTSLGQSSLVLVPMRAKDRLLGAIALISTNRDQPFDIQDLALADDLAFRAALAIDNARLYEEARAANKTKSDLLAAISHDLRTPLNAIIGYAELLEEGIPESLSEASGRSVRRMRLSAKHLGYLIEELLAYAKIDAHPEPKLQDVDLAEIGRETIAIMEPLALERGLHLSAELPELPATIRTDPDKLRQVLLNLVGNSVKYTRRGQVRLQITQAEDGRALIRVRDTGIGIAPEHLQHIFEPFWQVDPSQRARAQGTGLGLSVVRRLAELLGATVAVESTLGNGSTFIVTLPAGDGRHSATSPFNTSGSEDRV